MGREGVTEGIDYRTVPVVAALRTIPDSPWSLVARVDTAEMYGPLREQLTLVVALIGALLVGAGTSVSLLWRQQSERYYRDRYEAAETLRQSEEQLRAMFELASVGIAQADPRTGQFVRVNEKMCAITGYSADELLRMHLSEVTHPEDRQSDWEAYQRVVRGEQPDYRMEKRYVRKDSSLTWVNVNMTVIRDAAGQPTRTVATIEDITERRRAEEALRQQTEELRARNAELMRFNRAGVGRELQMVELKQQINELCRQLGQPPRHPLDFLGAKPQTPTAAEAVGPEGASRTEAKSSEERSFKASQTGDSGGVPQRTAD
jgi:PAS domain S-box-containing protein